MNKLKKTFDGSLTKYDFSLEEIRNMFHDGFRTQNMFHDGFRTDQKNRSRTLKFFAYV